MPLDCWWCRLLVPSSLYSLDERVAHEPSRVREEGQDDHVYVAEPARDLVGAVQERDAAQGAHRDRDA